MPGLILAGGLSTRMGGGDKCLRQLGGRPLLAHVIDRLGPQAAPLWLNANGDPARFAAFGLPVLADGLADYPGPLAGVLAGLDHAADVGAQAIVTVAADTPFFPAGLMAGLVAAGQGGLALAASRDAEGRLWRHPTFGLWPVALRHDLRAALEGGLRKIVAWTDRHGAATAEFPGQPHDPFFNINTPEDMLEAETILGAGA